ncbi:MAG: Alkaline phosphatase synthesis sensor protein PhoR [Betaproteobacteria bacterium ADurb.Bin341]|nr:MAG: Alkaline phosphatase synthesis sensor protein PhoR [Betaproteobacteria bacterium ADurb.Bin341]
MFSKQTNTRISNTISFRVAAVYSLVFAFSFIAITLIAYLFLDSTLHRRDREQVRVELQSLRDQYLAGGRALFEQTVLNNDRFRKNNPFFTRIIDHKGHSVQVFFTQYWEEFNLSALDQLPVDPGDEWIYLKAREGKQQLEILTAELPDGFRFQVGISSADRQLILDQFTDTLLFVTVPLVLLGMAGGSFVARRILSPLRHLIRTVVAIQAGQMEARVPRSHNRDELDELGRLFNEMTGQIQRLIRGMKDALDNVAHDLRTPMTRFRNRAETALHQEGNPLAYREALQDCIEESDRILGMLAILMDISEAETGTLRLQRRRVDLVALVGAVVDMYQYVAEEKGIGIHLQLPPRMELELDPERISQVLANLLDNAVKYTPPAGRIDLAVLAEPGQVRIQVEDNGGGLDPAEIDHLWELLYRGRQATQKGIGLGLSLVRAIVQAHGGTVSARSAATGGALFEVLLPDPATQPASVDSPPEDRLGGKT